MFTFILNPFLISIGVWFIITIGLTAATINIPHHGWQLISALLTGMAAMRLIDVTRIFTTFQKAVSLAKRMKLLDIKNMINDLPENPNLSNVQDMIGDEITCEQCGFTHLPENWEFVERQSPEDESIDVYRCCSCGHLAYVRNKG